MKIAIIIIGVCWSSLALACPDIAGNYTCNDNGETYQTVITQHNRADGVTVYSPDGEEMIANGQKHDLDLDPGFVGTYVANCFDSSTLSIYINISVPSQDLVMDTVTIIQKNGVNSLDMNTVFIKSEDGKSENPEQQNISCVK